MLNCNLLNCDECIYGIKDTNTMNINYDVYICKKELNQNEISNLPQANQYERINNE